VGNEDGGWMGVGKCEGILTCSVVISYRRDAMHSNIAMQTRQQTSALW